jgi:hypothetical protein
MRVILGCHLMLYMAAHDSFTPYRETLWAASILFMVHYLIPFLYGALGADAFLSRAHLMQDHLRDAHAGVQLDRLGSEVPQLQRDLPLEVRVDETRRGLHDDRSPPDAAAAIHDADEVRWDLYALFGCAERELARMQHEASVPIDQHLIHRDGGGHQDGDENDGDYGGTFTHAYEEDMYEFLFRAYGTSRDGELVTREATLSKYVEGRAKLVPEGGGTRPDPKDPCCGALVRWLRAAAILLRLILIVLIWTWNR